MFKTCSTMTLLSLATISAADAQSSRPIQAKVPFTFTVQNTTLSAGTYQLTYKNSAHRLLIQGLDPESRGAFTTAVSTTVSGSANASARARLVFQCYDKTCYLAQVWQGTGAGGRGLEISQRGQERKLAFLRRGVSVTIPAK